MIEKLQNKDIKIAEKIRAVFQVSYKVEAKLLEALDFPPLKRPIEDYVNCENAFFGYFKDKELAAVIEIIHNNDYTHIRSLVVDPQFFRQGIASKLMAFTLNRFDSSLFIVETGLANGPATDLYKKFNFQIVKEWDTEYGIRKIKMELLLNNKR
uniref:GNAT family N-acetyltransferase n=1 Tax=Flavobacterium sp. TaxID=239 RepID=UPI00404A3C07